MVHPYSSIACICEEKKKERKEKLTMCWNTEMEIFQQVNIVK